MREFVYHRWVLGYSEEECSTHPMRLYIRVPVPTQVLNPQPLPTRQCLLSCYLYHKTFKTSQFTCSFQSLGLSSLWPQILLAYSIGWYLRIHLSANVTFPEKPAPTTLFQMAYPYSLSHHPLIVFTAITIICKGLVNMLVDLFRICVPILDNKHHEGKDLVWYLAHRRAH